MTVSVKIPQKEHLTQCGFVEPSIELMAKEEVCVLGGIIDTTTDSLHLNLMNYGSTEKILFRNTNLATCESFYENTTEINHIAAAQETEPPTSLDETVIPEHLTDLYSRSSKHLTEAENYDLGKLLVKYQSVFSKSSDDIGHTNIVQHSINTRVDSFGETTNRTRGSRENVETRRH